MKILKILKTIKTSKNYKNHKTPFMLDRLSPWSLERSRREMRQAKPPARGGAARASLGLLVVLGCSLLLS